jgi:hypothetical protein
MCLNGWIIFWALFWLVLLPGGLCALILYFVARSIANRSHARKTPASESSSDARVTMS